MKKLSAGKRALSFLLALVMLLTNFPLTSFAEAAEDGAPQSDASAYQGMTIACIGDSITAGVGVKGIRMISSIDKDVRNSLISGVLAGYTLVEYGTALAWVSDLDVNTPLVLGRDYTKSNFAYKREEADPIINRTGNLIQYTNVLVGFSDEQCIPDIVMRSYITLEDAQGNRITLYGGQVVRSIGYIAWQNRSVFNPGSAAYDYVWNIIHYVYGDRFDEDYKG